ncbi:Sfum_1244 family protein [uncultured Cocleimonas sp.]|uniref:Sfum_1244 family protein n=1 Tax=uncultured Cocleimonas sp. TaxID=1051587 RepID=UPI002615D6B4|nr:Sfum_1244 family protein [uncultured Cocleimonas sp.]
MDKQLKDVIDTVQHNCHIADARHAGDYTLCVYLLKMREMYRWEQSIDFKTMLTTDDVGDWLTSREGVWDELEEQEYKNLEIDEKTFKPFENELINSTLDDKKLVYNAGLGIRSRPHFFIAELEKFIQHDDYTIFISNKEFARDMAAPPAMAQGKNIFVRRESLRRVIWEILDDARVAGLDNPLTRAMSFYDFETDPETAINQMTEVEIEYVIEHEIGEVKAGELLGKLNVANDGDQVWNEMLDTYSQTHAEIMLRAIRDHIADSITTLPKLLEDVSKGENMASLHFYFGNLTAMRKHLAPKLVDAYQQWNETGSLDLIQQSADLSKNHWLKLSQQLIEQFLAAKDSSTIEEIITENKLI